MRVESFSGDLLLGKESKAKKSFKRAGKKIKKFARSPAGKIVMGAAALIAAPVFLPAAAGLVATAVGSGAAPVVMSAVSKRILEKVKKRKAENNSVSPETVQTVEPVQEEKKKVSPWVIGGSLAAIALPFILKK